MLPLHLTVPQDRPLSVLTIGAHPDDIEIGAGGTLLSLAESHPGLQARYVVLTGNTGAPAGSTECGQGLPARRGPHHRTA